METQKYSQLPKKQKETILDFSKGTVKVFVKIYFALI